jgi:hypothetical protein
MKNFTYSWMVKDASGQIREGQKTIQCADWNQALIHVNQLNYAAMLTYRSSGIAWIYWLNDN